MYSNHPATPPEFVFILCIQLKYCQSFRLWECRNLTIVPARHIGLTEDFGNIILLFKEDLKGAKTATAKGYWQAASKKKAGCPCRSGIVVPWRYLN